MLNKVKQKNYIKDLGIFLDEHLSWEYQIKHVNNKIAKNVGIITKLRYHLVQATLFYACLSISQLWNYKLGEYVYIKAEQNKNKTNWICY